MLNAQIVSRKILLSGHFKIHQYVTFCYWDYQIISGLTKLFWASNHALSNATKVPESSIIRWERSASVSYCILPSFKRLKIGSNRHRSWRKIYPSNFKVYQWTVCQDLTQNLIVSDIGIFLYILSILSWILWGLKFKEL